jgi:cholesterol oxidase
MATEDSFDIDHVVVGSGFGGSVSACRLAEKGYSVAVIEMGKRWNASDFPKSTWNLRRWIWRPGMKLHGFYNMRPFRHVMILCGNAVGGGSITYANTMLVPPDSVWRWLWKGLAVDEDAGALRVARRCSASPRIASSATPTTC